MDDWQITHAPAIGETLASKSAGLGLQQDHLTGNRYLYAGANPINMIDDGHAPHCQSCADFASGVLNGVLFNTGEPVERALGIHQNVRHQSGWRDAGDVASMVVPGGAILKGVSKGVKALRGAQKARNARKAATAGRTVRGARRAASACMSFAGGTPVLMADGTRKRIDQVKRGDVVLATDPETGETGPRKVIATHPHSDQLLTLRTSTGEIVTTEDHKYWNATDREWQESQHLDEGDRLLSADGDMVTVEGLDWARLHLAPAYDLSVAGVPTYYVGAGVEAVLVHNCFALEALSASGRAADKGGLSRAGRAYQKHMGRGELPHVGGAQLDRVGQNLLDDILTAPGTRIENVTSGNFKGGVRYIRSDGTGATFDASGNLRYFGTGY